MGIETVAVGGYLKPIPPQATMDSLLSKTEIEVTPYVYYGYRMRTNGN